MNMFSDLLVRKELKTKENKLREQKENYIKRELVEYCRTCESDLNELFEYVKLRCDETEYGVQIDVIIGNGFHEGVRITVFNLSKLSVSASFKSYYNKDFPLNLDNKMKMTKCFKNALRYAVKCALNEGCNIK